MYDMAEDVNPAANIYTCICDTRKVTKRETASVVGGKLGRIRKGLPPPFDVRFVDEFDMSEEAFLCARNPRFRDEATGFESV